MIIAEIGRMKSMLYLISNQRNFQKHGQVTVYPCLHHLNIAL